MIETSLITLNEAIAEGQTLSTGLKVVLPIGSEAEIYGFIAIDNNNLFGQAIDMPPMGECQVLSNRVFFYLNEQIYRFPIFRSVGKATEEKYKLYFLYIPKFLNLSQYDRDVYFQSMKNEHANQKVKRIDGIRIDENGFAYYYAQDDDLFFNSASKLCGIGSGFAVITRRMAQLSENIKYELFDSNGVMTERTVTNPFDI